MIGDFRPQNDFEVCQGDIRVLKSWGDIFNARVQYLDPFQLRDVANHVARERGSDQRVGIGHLRAHLAQLRRDDLNILWR